MMDSVQNEHLTIGWNGGFGVGMPRHLRVLFTAALCTMILVAGRVSLFGAGTLSAAAVTPGEATANSVYEYSVLYQEPEEGKLPDSIKLIRGNASFVLNRTSEYRGSDIRDAGITYHVRVTAGLDLKNSGGSGTFLPDPLLRYDPGLTARSNGEPQSYSFRFEAVYQPPTPASGTIPDPVTLRASGTGPTVHDTFIYDIGTLTVDRYGGQSMSRTRDWMFDYPSGYPVEWHSDPLHVEPYVEAFPDSGTSTSTYTFRVHYRNWDGQPARPWVLDHYEPWSIQGGYECGVMVYLRNLDAEAGTYWSEFHGHFMYKEDPATGLNTQGIYILRVVPSAGMIRTRAGEDHWRTTWGWTSTTNNYYEALPPGRYEYFFACSDDDFSAFGDLKDSVWPYLDDDPALATPLPPNDRTFSMGGLNWTKTTDAASMPHGFVDKTTYMAGALSLIHI